MTLQALLFGGLLAGGLRGDWPWTAAAAALWTAALLRPPLRPAATPLWAAWLAWAAASALLSGEPALSVAALAQPASAGLVFALARGWSARERRLWTALLVAAGCAVSAAALLLPPEGLLPPNKNYSAAAAAAAFAAAAAALSSGALAPRHAGAAAAAAALCLGAVLLSGSRAALLACAVSGALALARARRWRTFAAAAVLGAALLARPALWRKADDPAGLSRARLWAAAAAAAAERPLFGEGPGLFERGFLRHQVPSPPGHRPTRYGLSTRHAHSQPLQAAAETGLPGLALLLAALLAALRGAGTRARSWEREAGLAAAAALSVPALFDNPFALPALGWLYASALAAAGGEREPGAAAVPRAWLAAGLLLCLCARLPARLLARARLEGRVEDALRIAPRDARLWEEAARRSLRRSPPDERGALAALARAEELAPMDASYPLIAAEIARRRGLWPQTLALSERALALEPGCVQARLLRAESLWRTGRRPESRRALAELGDPRPRDPSGLSPYDALILHVDRERLREVRRLIRD